MYFFNELNMQKLPQKIVGTVGRCIYCGKSEGNLSDEHIIPFGLNGPYLLKKASCDACSAVTSNFEREVLRTSLISPRIGLDLPTRNKSNRPNSIGLNVTKNGQDKVIQLEPSENFSVMILIEYLPPAFFDGRTIEKGISAYATTMVQVSGPPIGDLKTKYDFDSFSVSATWGGKFFPQLLSKIAYGFAVALFGYDNIEKNFVLPFIMGEKFDGISEWVGTAPDKKITEKSFHTVKVDVTENLEIIVRMKLFDLWDVPEYLVVVGKLNKDTPKLFEKVTN